MASDVKHPEDVMVWFIKGNNLALATTEGTDSSSVHSKLGDLKAVDTATTDGILIHYYGEPDKISVSASGDYSSSYPDIDNTMHTPLIDYIKARLYQDKAGQSAEPNMSAISLNLSNLHDAKWNDAVKKFRERKLDKVGGLRAVRPFDLR